MTRRCRLGCSGHHVERRCSRKGGSLIPFFDRLTEAPRAATSGLTEDGVCTAAGPMPAVPPTHPHALSSLRTTSMVATGRAWSVTRCQTAPDRRSPLSTAQIIRSGPGYLARPGAARPRAWSAGRASPGGRGAPHTRHPATRESPPQLARRQRASTHCRQIPPPPRSNSAGASDQRHHWDIRRLRAAISDHRPMLRSRWRNTAMPAGWEPRTCERRHRRPASVKR